CECQGKPIGMLMSYQQPEKLEVVSWQSSQNSRDLPLWMLLKSIEYWADHGETEVEVNPASGVPVEATSNLVTEYLTSYRYSTCSRLRLRTSLLLRYHQWKSPRLKSKPRAVRIGEPTQPRRTQTAMTPTPAPKLKLYCE
ncbi:MAG: hypothetical protein KDA78_21040, partial [Planctomycetaceae bacterium]|nr:hypothetical protein [Planctomycetaceae bacterium]